MQVPLEFFSFDFNDWNTDMEVSLIKQQTCRVSDSGRSRNIMTRALVRESDAIKHFVPSANANSGATKQVQDIWH